MKTKITTLLLLFFLAGVAIAQVSPIDFETEGYGADWTWSSFENDTNPPVAIVENPSPSGMNQSGTVVSMTALTAGQPWAGFESQHGSDIGSFSWNVTNTTVKIMVYKPVISDVGLKFVEANSDAQPEIKVANTLINQWEELTFDFSSHIGSGATGILDQIVIFPDFDLSGRTTDNTCYFDSITFSGQILPPGPIGHAPVPTALAADVISVFSDSYSNIAGTNFYPGWGQATVVTEVSIEGNNTLLYSGLNYQGIELGSVQELMGMDSVHLDFWSANSTELQLFLISESSGEQSFSLPITHDAWISADVPLTHFADLGLSMSDINQIKFVGNGDIFLDNLYFKGEGGGLEPAPHAPIDFETEGFGADWTWSTFENGGNEPFEIISNPDTSGINTSATVGSMTTLTIGAAWAGVESQHGADIGSFSWDTTNSTVTIMVYKSVLSDVGLKFVEANGEAQPQIKVPNTLINEWEELTFDFSSHIGLGATGILDQIVIFPDFDLNGRTTDNPCYFDNISFSAQTLPAIPVDHAPIPTAPSENVISVFSDDYTNIIGTDFYPNWGQATVVTEVAIAGRNTLLYSGLNYQGIALASSQNVSNMDKLHVDFWSANSTELNIFLISPGPVETPYSLPVSPETWVSVDIPLTAFAPVDLTDVFQFKIEGNGDVYLDNLYFSSTTTDIEDNLAPEIFVLKQNYPNPFNPSTIIRYSLVESGRVVLKLYNINGQELATLVDRIAGSGEYSHSLNAGELAAGTYLYSLTAGNQTTVRKMVLIK